MQYYHLPADDLRCLTRAGGYSAYREFVLQVHLEQLTDWVAHSTKLMFIKVYAHALPISQSACCVLVISMPLPNDPVHLAVLQQCRWFAVTECQS